MEPRGAPDPGAVPEAQLQTERQRDVQAELDSEPEPELEPCAPDEPELRTVPSATGNLRHVNAVDTAPPPQTLEELAESARQTRLEQLQASSKLDRDDAELHVAELAHQQRLLVRVLSNEPDIADELAGVAKNVSVTLATLSGEYGIELVEPEPEPEPNALSAPPTGAVPALGDGAERVRRLVASVPIFAALGRTEPEFTRRIALKLQRSDYTCGDTVLGLGERSWELFFLARGAVKVRGETEQEQSQADLTAGAFNLRILTLGPAAPMTATVFATRDTCMLRLSQADLIDVLQQFGGFQEYMVATDGGQDEGKAKLVRTASAWRLAQAAVKHVSPLLLNRIKDEQAVQEAALGTIGRCIADMALAGGPALAAPPPPPNFWRDNLEHVVAYPLLISPRVKKQIRLGVPHPYRRVVWLRLSGAEEFCRGDYDGYYEASLRLCLKVDKLPQDGSYPTVEGKFPTFGGQLVQYEWLTEEHFQAAKRLLLTLKQFEAKMNYCPMLPSVLCALLQALSEAEVYAVVLALVDRSLQPNTQPKLPHFQLTQQQEIIFEMTFYDIAANYVSTAVKALKVHLPSYPPEKDAEDDFWDTWKHSFFCNKLPLQSVLKIVDIWMSEGHKAIFRVALALLNEHTEQLRSASDRVDAMDLLCPITPLATRVPVNDNRLLSQAFKLSLSRKQLQSLDKANEGKAGMAVSLRPAATRFHKPHWSLKPILENAQSSRILSQMQLEALWELLPPTLEAATPQLLYSSIQHGYALQRMFEQCDWANGHALNHGAIDHAGALLIVQTTAGNIIGGFCDRRLEPHGGRDVKYCGRRGCFVFVFAPGLEVNAKAYRWSGLNEMFWRALRPQGTLGQRAQGKARPSSLSLGGGTGAMDAGLGYALYIDADGQAGSTAACETFASPALINAKDPFAPTGSPTKNSTGGDDGGTAGSPVSFTIATLELILLTEVPCTF